MMVSNKGAPSCYNVNSDIDRHFIHLLIKVTGTLVLYKKQNPRPWKRNREKNLMIDGNKGFSHLRMPVDLHNQFQEDGSQWHKILSCVKR